MKRKLFPLILSLILCFNLLSICALAAPREFASEEALAADLKELGLFKGVSDTDFDLERAPTRIEALVMLIRVLGKEADALGTAWEHPFKDVPQWADRYVGYAYRNQLTSGISDTEFGLSDASAAHYLTFMLRALGYTDVAGADFTWDSPFALANQAGILRDGTDVTAFLRADIVRISYAALQTTLKNSDQTLAQKLIASGVFTLEQFNAVYDASAFADAEDDTPQALTARQISDLTSDAVFYIEVFETQDDYLDEYEYATGSGFLIGSDGTAVTNYHVIEDTLAAAATMKNGKVYPIEKVLYYDMERDIAVIRLSHRAKDGSTAASFPALKMRDSSAVHNGDKVFAIGSPLGLQNSITDGIVSNAQRLINDEPYPYIQMTAAISPGSSGGVLLNEYGEAIGITTAYLVDGQSLNLAVPLDWIMTQDLKIKGADFAEVYRTEFRNWLQLADFDFAENVFYEDFPEEVFNVESIYSGNTIIGSFSCSSNLDYYCFTTPIPVYLTAYAGGISDTDYDPFYDIYANSNYEMSWDDLILESFILTLDDDESTLLYAEDAYDEDGYAYELLEGVYLEPGRYYLCALQTFDDDTIWEGRYYYVYLHLDPA